MKATNKKKKKSDYLTVGEVAKLRKVKEATVYRWIVAGLPSVKQFGVILVHWSDACGYQPKPVGFPKDGAYTRNREICKRQEARRKEVNELRGMGWTIKRIAEALEIAQSTVWFDLNYKPKDEAKK